MSETPNKYNAVPEAGSSIDQLKNLFTYHKPVGDQQERYEALRESAYMLAMLIVNVCPPGPDRTAAIRKLRECVMTANAAIATGGGFFS